MNGAPDGFVGRKVQAVWVGWIASGFLRPSAPLGVRRRSSTAPLQGFAQDDRRWRGTRKWSVRRGLLRTVDYEHICWDFLHSYL